jgi:hypothetical protein
MIQSAKPKPAKPNIFTQNNGDLVNKTFGFAACILYAIAKLLGLLRFCTPKTGGFGGL